MSVTRWWASSPAIVDRSAVALVRLRRRHSISIKRWPTSAPIVVRPTTHRYGLPLRHHRHRLWWRWSWLLRGWSGRWSRCRCWFRRWSGRRSRCRCGLFRLLWLFGLFRLLGFLRFFGLFRLFGLLGLFRLLWGFRSIFGLLWRSLWLWLWLWLRRLWWLDDLNGLDRAATFRTEFVHNPLRAAADHLDYDDVGFFIEQLVSYFSCSQSHKSLSNSVHFLSKSNQIIHKNLIKKKKR